ncbi:MAG: C13 family peptidase [Caldilineaceae bacterium]
MRALLPRPPGLLIIVAGQIKNNDPVQPNIYHVTDAVRQLFIDKGATDEQIYYIAPDLSRTGVDASATADNLEAAITQWADQQAATAQSLTLYLMDHGGQDIFYLDKLRSEWITPAELDGWLDELEALRPTLNINVIYEACESGSFVSGSESISKPGRVIISSTDDENLAWASDDGAIFSDHLLDSLRRGESLYISYQNARIAPKSRTPIKRRGSMRMGTATAPTTPAKPSPPNAASPLPAPSQMRSGRLLLPKCSR